MGYDVSGGSVEVLKVFVEVLRQCLSYDFGAFSTMLWAVICLSTNAISLLLLHRHFYSLYRLLLKTESLDNAILAF